MAKKPTETKAKPRTTENSSALVAKVPTKVVPGGVRIRVLRPTVVESHHIAMGAELECSARVAKYLIDIGKAEYV